MDNALIDDRRIHVDFSQSVAKLWSQYRRKDQRGKGGGCFKCGSTDHIAKDCTADATMQQQPAKFVLKDTNAQRGGDDTRYEMVFDGDNSESPRRDIKDQRRDRDDLAEKKRRKENFEDHVHRGRRNEEMVGSNNRNKYTDRSRGHGGSDRNARDSDSQAERKDRDNHRGRHRDDDYRRKDDRYTDRHASGDYRREPDASHLEKRDDRDYTKRSEDGRRHDGKIDSSRRKRSPGEEDYKHRRRDEDYKHKREHEDYKHRRGDEDYKHRREDEDFRRRRDERGHKRQDTESHRRHHGDRR